MKSPISIIILVCYFTTVYPLIAQTDSFLKKLLQKEPERYSAILAEPTKYKIQLLYTKIDRNAQNEPKFTTYQYGVNDQSYFYPASAVKLLVATLALEKINTLNIKGLNKFTPMLTDADQPFQTIAHVDTTAENGLPSVAHYIKKILIASDDSAYNRLYEFLGPDYIQQKLQEKGYPNTRIVHRLPITHSQEEEENKYTNPIRFVEGQQVLYHQPSSYATSKVNNLETNIGKNSIQEGILVNTPTNFATKNRFPLTEQHTLLKALFFPNQVAIHQRFQLNPDDYQFLYRYMSQLPIETDYPAHYSEDLYDAYTKFLLFGGSQKRVPRHIRSFNKSGKAYGFLLDNAYIADFERGVEFLVSAVIYCNETEVLDEKKHEYEKIGLPFLENIGKTLLHYEVQRNRKRRPDLDLYEVEYDR